MLHAAFLRNQLISLLILDSFQKSFLEAGGTSKPMDLDIELVNCDITAFKQGQALMNPLMIFIKIIRGFIRTQYKSKTKSP